MMKYKYPAALLLASFLLGMGTYRTFFTESNTSSIQTTEKQILYWVAPMDAAFRRDKPGKSPMGMDLVPVYADNGDTSPDKTIIKINPSVEQNLGIRTAVVRKGVLNKEIQTVGYVAVDENRIQHIHTYVEGWIQQLNVKAFGDSVKKGDVLMELFAPKLINAQEEYLLALKSDRSSLVSASHAKLLTMGMSEEEIQKIKTSNEISQLVKVIAEEDGVVTRLSIREGMFVKPDKLIMELSDLSQAWVVAEVFEKQAAWVSAGQRVEATFPYLPGVIYRGKLDYVYPELNPKTHTLKVRISFPNTEGSLRPNMYSNVKIFSDEEHDTLIIPTEALIRGDGHNRIVLSLGKGRFQSRKIVIGAESGNHIAVLSGLKEGDVVVASAQFLLDSESNIQAGLNRLENEEEGSE
jgi:membrane fusion protein, copper/silver efflux system